MVAVLDESLLNIFEIGVGDEAEESIANVSIIANNRSTSASSGGGGAGVDDVSSFLSLSPFEEAATSHHHHHTEAAAAIVTAASPYVSCVDPSLPLWRVSCCATRWLTTASPHTQHRTRLRTTHTHTQHTHTAGRVVVRERGVFRCGLILRARSPN
jgi:hypothetical protein